MGVMPYCFGQATARDPDDLDYCHCPTVTREDLLQRVVQLEALVKKLVKNLEPTR